MKSAEVLDWLLILSLISSVQGQFSSHVLHEISDYEIYSSLPEKFRTQYVIVDQSDRCNWFPACICRDETIYTNGSYKLFVNCTQSGLQKVPRNIPTTTTVLTLDGNSIQKIEPGTFKNLTILKYLDLSDNRIKTLGVGVFEGLENLQTLELSGNKIRYDAVSLPDDIFKPLKKLVRLNLHQNLNGIDKNEKYPTKALSDLTKLNHLLIDGLQPENINDTISFVTSLRTLELSSDCGRCSLRKITVDMFRNLGSVTDLKVSNCSLHYVEKGSFSALKNLSNLDMSYNEKLHFKNLANITFGLQSNNIRAMKLVKIHETFGDCVRLEASHLLYLKHMNVSDVYLDNNRLSYVAEEAVKNIPRNIRKLSLTNNMLLAGEYLHKLFESAVLDKLKYLTLAEQNMNYDAMKFFNNQTRRMITSLQENYTNSQLPFSERNKKEEHMYSFMHGTSTVNTLEKGNVIYCSNCYEEVSKHDVILYFPVLLKDLDFSGLRIRNELKRICICEPNSLLRINLERNIFWNWQGPVSGLSNLLRLNLAWNSCDNLSVDVFDQMTSLIELNLTRNFIERFLREDTKGRIFQNLKNLQILLLSDNKIRNLPTKLFQGLKSLRGLDLSFNFLTQIDLEFAPDCALQYVDLSNNLLNKIGTKLMQKYDDEIKSEHLFDRFYLDLTNNRLSCTCNDTDFIAWVSRTKVRFINFDDYLCRYGNGEELKLSTSSAIHIRLEKDCAEYTMVIIFVCLSFIIFLAVILGGMTYRYRWNLRYFYYSVKLRMNGNTPLVDEEDRIVFPYDAFISYASENARFVKNDLVPELEDKRQLQLMVHDRDFRAGEFVNDNIMKAISTSRKTLILMSKDFLKSDWCIFEMNMARLEAIKTGRNVVCLVMLEDVPAAGLPLEIMDIIRQHTYLELPVDMDHLDIFWDRVHSALIR